MIIKINEKNPEKEYIEIASKILRKGGIVAFPTETVYGLGANALNKEAVKKIFKLKGRPLDNPIIVHIASIEDLRKVAKDIPREALKLTKNFWPGPLTLVLKKSNLIPPEITAGLDTVAVRMPSNKIALALIKASGPIAAPSANKSGRPSPTTAQDVEEDFNDILILDGGKTKYGVESTVVDVEKKLLLRPGAITLEQLRKYVNINIPEKREKRIKRVPSPGMKYKHYAPKAKLILVMGNKKEMISKIVRNYQSNEDKARIAVMTTVENKKIFEKKCGKDLFVIGSRKNMKSIAKNLFLTLRKIDRKSYEKILCETFPEKGIGLAIMDRLKRAASKVI